MAKPFNKPFGDSKFVYADAIELKIRNNMAFLAFGLKNEDDDYANRQNCIAMNLQTLKSLEDNSRLLFAKFAEQQAKQDKSKKDKSKKNKPDEPKGKHPRMKKR